MKCKFCRGKKFIGHQLMRADVEVDDDGKFAANLDGGLEAHVYDAETPYGPFTCAKCGAEYEGLCEDAKVISGPTVAGYQNGDIQNVAYQRLQEMLPADRCPSFDEFIEEVYLNEYVMKLLLKEPKEYFRYLEARHPSFRGVLWDEKAEDMLYWSNFSDGELYDASGKKIAPLQLPTVDLIDAYRTHRSRLVRDGTGGPECRLAGTKQLGASLALTYVFDTVGMETNPLMRFADRAVMFASVIKVPHQIIVQEGIFKHKVTLILPAKLKPATIDSILSTWFTRALFEDKTHSD